MGKGDEKQDRYIYIGMGKETATRYRQAVKRPCLRRFIHAAV
jgi:hypothetical protein